MRTRFGRRPRIVQPLLSAALLFIVLVLTLSQSVVLFASADEAAIARTLVLQAVLLAVFWWWSAVRSGSLLNAPFVLIVAIFFWHSSFVLGRYLHLSRLFEYSGIFLTYGEEFTPVAVAFVSFCMILGIAGSVIAFWQRAEEAAPIAKQVRPVDPAVERYALILFVAYVVLTLLYHAKENAFAAQDYLDTYALASGSIVYRLYHMTKFLGVPLIAMVIATARRRAALAFAYAGTAFLIFVTAVTGARTMPFLYCATVLISIDAFRKRIPFVAIAAATFVAALASEVITEARGSGVGLNLFRSIYADPSISSLWRLLWGSGATFGVVLRTMAFSAKTGLMHGRSFVDAFVYLIPGPLVKLVAPAWTVLPPSEWLLRESSDLAAGEGLGYSLIAEAFLNFGVWGCFLFLILGWLVAYPYFRFRFRRDIFSGLQSLSLVVLLSLHLRNDSITYVRVLVWGALIIFAGRLIGMRFRRSQLETAQAPLYARTPA